MISFVADTYRQGWWPFFHSWLLAPVFILFGNTYAVARSVSLFCLILFIPVIYFIGLEMSERQGHWIGLTVACLSLTSLPILVLSSMCMAEIPGLLLTFLTFLVYLKSMRRQDLRLLILCGILMAATLFTKWHHGVFVIAAVLFTQFTQERAILARRNIALFLPFLFIMILWFVYPPHLTSFYGHSTFQPHYYSFFSRENWLYYLGSFVQIYHASRIVALMVAVGFIYALKDLKNPKVRLFATHVFIGLILLTIKLDNRHRYIVTIVPSIWVLAAGQWMKALDAFNRILRSKQRRVAAVVTLAIGIAMIAVPSVSTVYKRYPSALSKYNFWCDKRLNKAYEFISNNVADNIHLVAFGSWDYYNSLKGSTIRWNLGVKRSRDPSIRKNEKRLVAHYFSEFCKNKNGTSLHRLISFLENKDIQVDEYHLLSFMKMQNEKDYRNYRQQMSMNPFSDRMIDVNSLSPQIKCLITIYNNREKELNSFAERFFSLQDQWVECTRKEFRDINTTICIYKRRESAKTA
jgi:hypothetical protein